MAIANHVARTSAAPSDFGHLLKRLRTAAELTQEELAERAGVSARLVSDLERGTIHRPRRDTIRMLADGLRLADADRELFTAVARGRPVQSIATTTTEPARRTNLPVPPSALVGREREVAATTSLLARPDVRLLTLTGPGGVGKTRLALDVAARLGGAFADGVWFVDLAPVADPLLVLPAIAQVLGVRSSGERPLRDDLVAALQGKRLLVVLDNLEHLPPAAPAIADLIAACSDLTFLATSRQPLRLRAEREYVVSPLALPDLNALPQTDDLARVPAVELFVQRAEAARRTFALTAENARAVAELTARLDGLPLAIELAAARVKILTPAALLERLDRRLPMLTGGPRDLPARLQTMRAAIDWSYGLLTPDEQGIFRRLAVFTGGFTLDAAEAVCGPQGTARIVSPRPCSLFPVPSVPSVLDLLASLVDKSLLRTLDRDDEPRFGMLETIREYGLEQVAEAGEEAEMRDRHAAWCLELAERAEPELTGPEQEHWYAHLDAEHDNVRAALAWTLERGQAGAQFALRFGAALYRYWATFGHFEEGRRWLDLALARDQGSPTAARAHAMLGAGVMGWLQGDYARSTAWTEGAQAVFRALGDRTGIAYTFGNLGLVADAMSDFDRAEAMYGEALQLFRALDDRTHIGYMLNNLGVIAYLQGDYARAAALHEEALALRRELGQPDGVAYTLGNLGEIAYAQGDYARAAALQAECLTMRREQSNKVAPAKCFENFALIAVATGEAERAACLFGAAEALRDRLGAPMPPSDRPIYERGVADVRARLDEHTFAAAWETGRIMPVNEAIDYALERGRQPAAGDRRPDTGPISR
jgi:predicted ATPase/transcriptional regulator with XRE-family HTH domain